MKTALWKKIVLIGILACLTYTFSFARKISGKVTSTSGELLEYATIYLKGSTYGTSANAKGEFFLEIPDTLSGELVCQYIGYTSKSHILPPGTANLQIKEVVVSARTEDPAYAIMRKVIALKNKHKNSISSLETDVYLKGSLGLDSIGNNLVFKTLTAEESGKLKSQLEIDSSSTLLYFVEQISKYYYQPPNKTYTHTLFVKESGNPQGLGAASMPSVINIYENNIKIFDDINPRGFISPAHNNAFLYYRFEFQGSYFDQGKEIHQIKVIPKRKHEPVFSGTVYVVEGDFVFQAIDLSINSQYQLDLLNAIHLKQQFIKTPQEIWAIQHQQLYFNLAILGIHFNGGYLSAYQNHRINQAIPDSIFNARTLASYAENALNTTTQQWDTLRPVPLAEEEYQEIKLGDSVGNFSQRFSKKTDSLNASKKSTTPITDYLLNPIDVRLNDKLSFRLSGLISTLGYNSVEGIYYAIEPSLIYKFNNHQKVIFDITPRYGFSNHHFNLQSSIAFKSKNDLHPDNHWSLKLSGGKYIFQLNENNPIDGTMNILYQSLYGYNYMKLYEKTFLQANYEHDFGNGFSANLSAGYAYRQALENTSFYTFNDDNKKYFTPNNPDNLPVFENHNALIASLQIQYQPGWKYIQYPKFKKSVPSAAPTFYASYTKGIPTVFKSKVDFDKWQLGVRHKMGLRLLGNLNYHINAGGFFNTNWLGNPDYFHLNGNRTFLYKNDLNSFMLAPYYDYSHTGKLYGIAHIEWNLNGWLTNKIPGFNMLKWYLVAGNHTFYLHDNESYYTEFSIGLDNLGWGVFRLGRFDFVWAYGTNVKQPYYGFRLSLSNLLSNMMAP